MRCGKSHKGQDRRAGEDKSGWLALLNPRLLEIVVLCALAAPHGLCKSLPTHACLPTVPGPPSSLPNCETHYACSVDFSCS